MDIHIPLGPQSLPQAVLSAGARVVGLIYSGARSILLVGPGGSGKTLTLDIALDGMPGTVHRVVNHGAGPLDLRGILRQLGVADATGEGAAAAREALVRALAGSPVRPVVLAVDDAQSLTAEAALALAALPGLWGKEASPIVILAGTPALRGVLARRGLRALRGRDAAVTLPAPAGHAGFRGRTLLGLPRRRVTIGGALAACALSVAAVVVTLPGERAGQAEAARDAARPEIAAAVAAAVRDKEADAAPAVAAVVAAAPSAPIPAVEPARPEPVPVAAAGPALGLAAAPAAATAAGPVAATDTQLRQEFGAFLNRAGPDTARLPAARREALFSEYLAWRGRTEAGRR